MGSILSKSNGKVERNIGIVTADSGGKGEAEIMTENDEFYSFISRE